MTIFSKHFILFVLQGCEYASDKTKQNPGVLSFISQNIMAATSANLLLDQILFSNYYLAVRHKSHIQYTCLSFQTDSPFQLTTYDFNQSLFTCPNASQLLVISLVKVKKSKVNYAVLSYYSVILGWCVSHWYSSSQQIQGQSQEFHHLELFLRWLACSNTLTISFFILVSFFFEDFFKASKE